MLFLFPKFIKYIQDECKKLLTKCTNSDIHFSPKWANLILGLEYLKEEKYFEAKRFIQNVLNVDESDFNAWECLGVCYWGINSLQASIKTFQKALEINPDSFYSDFKYFSLQLNQGLKLVIHIRVFLSEKGKNFVLLYGSNICICQDFEKVFLYQVI